MNIDVLIDGRTLSVQLSRAAEQALGERVTPLVVEMELYFSCLIRKRVRFHTVQRTEQSVAVNNRLNVSFRPMMTEQCRLDDNDDAPVPSTEFPIVKAAAYIPHWLKIDYRKGEWLGEFGYL